jgi:hypothetical protein
MSPKFGSRFDFAAASMKETAEPVLAKSNIMRKKGKFNFKIGRIRFLFYIVQICVILSASKEVIIIIWPNRGDNNHALIVTIVVHSQTDE